MKPQVIQHDFIDPVRVFETVYDTPYALFFDSADTDHANAQFSFICINPAETITWKNGDSNNPFQSVQEKLNAYATYKRPDNLPDHIPFWGGAAGYFGYDCKNALEKLPAPKPSPKPDIIIGIYTHVIIFDHVNKKTYEVIEDKKKSVFLIKEKENKKSDVLNFQPTQSKSSFTASIQKTIDHIFKGDIFQANLAQKFEAELPENFSVWEHYKYTRTKNPAPFSAFMNCEEFQIGCHSPERFIQVQNGTAITQPIKGTLPADQEKSILETSEKDRAENIMIVDLLRNDLSKTCTPESVEVTKLCAIETFRNVHHMVSTVRGTLQKDKTALDCLQASFPGGSITGAPKIRSMEIINDLEETSRGIYCGSMGYIGFNGDMDTNIIIRTIIYEKDKAHFHVGGGITSLSDPEKEYQETLDKAKGLL